MAYVSSGPLDEVKCRGRGLVNDQPKFGPRVCCQLRLAITLAGRPRVVQRAQLSSNQGRIGAAIQVNVLSGHEARKRTAQKSAGRSEFPRIAQPFGRD